MRYAAKRLTRSDLTFFEVQFRRVNAGGQKSINLNRDVFIDQLFPGAPALAGGHAIQFPAALRIFGPDGRGVPHQVLRKVIAAGDRQKNWRLNGETVKDPDGGADPTRYDGLAEGDYVVMGFADGVVPGAIDLFLVTRAARDLPIHGELDLILGRRVMMVLGRAEQTRLAGAAGPDHPISAAFDAQTDVLLEEAVLGSADAVRKLTGPVRRRTAADLAAASARNAEIGRNGEVLAMAHLRALEARGEVTDIVWESDLNPVNPWDITYIERAGTERRAEVKTTNSPHERAIHISQAEIETAAADTSPPTEIWRISRLDEDGGELRRSRNLREVAKTVSGLCAGFDPAFRPDGWTVQTSALGWDDPVTIRFDEDPEE